MDLNVKSLSHLVFGKIGLFKDHQCRWTLRNGEMVVNFFPMLEFYLD